MQVLDGQGLIHAIAAADLLTRVVADPTADAGKRMVFFKKRQRLPILARGDKRDKALGAHVGGAGGPAGSGALFGNGKGARDRLGVLLERRFTVVEPFVVFIGDADGTDFGAFAAAGAFINIDVTRLLLDPG